MILNFKDNSIVKELKNIDIENNNKKLKITYCNNANLNFSINGDTNFEINNYDEVYPYFKRLYDEISFGMAFSNNNIEDFRKNESQKVSDNELNLNPVTKEYHQKLFHDDIIEWYSDDLTDEYANKLVIREEDEKIILEFYKNGNNLSDNINVSIYNSGSKYGPFSFCFLRMFQNLQEYANDRDKQEDEYKRSM